MLSNCDLEMRKKERYQMYAKLSKTQIDKTEMTRSELKLRAKERFHRNIFIQKVKAQFRV